jgi:hypothetical protein
MQARANARKKGLTHFCHGVVVEQVGQSHLVIADVVAEAHVARDVDAGGVRGAPRQRPLAQVGGGRRRRAAERQEHDDDEQHRSLRSVAADRLN